MIVKYLLLFTREININHNLKHKQKEIILLLVNEYSLGKYALCMLPFFGVPGMALIQLEIVRPQIVTVKCSEPQADTIKVGVKEVV